MDNLKHIDIAGVVLRDKEGRYLMVQERQPQAYGLWNLPAGWVDEGETFQQAAIREAHEEVGLKVELTSQKPIYSENNTQNNHTYYAFLARIVGGELTVQEEELLDARWLKLDEIERLGSEDKIRNNWQVISIRKAEEHAHNRD